MGASWSGRMPPQDSDAELKQRFGPVAEELAAQEEQINAELIGVQGNPVDLGGYYKVDDAKASAAMRPSQTLNAIVDGV